MFIRRNAHLVLTIQPEPFTSGGMAHTTKRPGKKLAALRPVEGLIHWRSQMVTSNSSAKRVSDARLMPSPAKEITP